MKQLLKQIDKKYFKSKIKISINKIRTQRANRKCYTCDYFTTGQNYPYRGFEALQKLLDEFQFESVLDVGCGEGVHSEILAAAGKKVTALDYGESMYFKKNANKYDVVIADINQWNTDRKFDCIWCSHVLEHQWNVHIFLRKLYDLLEIGGVLAITVPPLKQTIVGGHVSLWTPGLLLYNLVLAGFDCSHAKMKTYDYDISIIVCKERQADLSGLEYDCGDIRRIRKYLPANLEYIKTETDDPFDGNIGELNW